MKMKTRVLLLLMLAWFASFLVLPSLGAAPSGKDPQATQGATSGSNSQASPNNGQQNVRMIWDYKTELGLTDEQVAGIKDAITGFQKEVVELRAKFQVVEIDLQNLIQKKADLPTVKAKLQESAAIQVDLRLADIETARKIDDILSPEQAKRWREIQQKEMNARGNTKPTKSTGVK